MLLIYLQCQQKEDYTPASFSYAVLCIVIIISVLGILGNSLMLLGIFKSKAHHSRFYSIIINIAISDSMMVSIIVPLSIYLSKEYSKNTLVEIPRTYQFFYMFLTLSVATATVLNLTFLFMDRYLFLRNPEIYSSELNRRKHFICIVMLWASSFAFSGLQKYIESSIFMLLYSLAILLPSGVIMVLILYAYWRHFNQNNSHRIRRIHSSHNTCSTKPSITRLGISTTSLQVTPFPNFKYLNSGALDARKPSDTPSVATLPGTPDDFLNNCFTKLPINKITSLETEKRKKRRFMVGKTVYERRIVLTLAIMTGIYWLNYIPVIIGGCFLLFCPECQCDMKDIVGAIIVCSFMFGSFLRPLVFLLRFSQPRNAICNLLNRRRKRKQTYQQEKDPYS